MATADLNTSVIQLYARHSPARVSRLPPAAIDYLDYPVSEVIEDPQAFFGGLKALPRVGSVTVEHVRQVVRDALVQQPHLLSEDQPISEEERDLIRRVQNARSVLYRGGGHRFNGLHHRRDAMDSDDFMPERSWQKALQAGHFHYIAATLPDFLKTDAVWRAEYAANGPDEAYVQRLAAMRETASMSDLTGDVFLNMSALQMLVTRRGKYAALTETDVAGQIGKIRETLKPHEGRIALRVVDYQVARLNCALLVPDDHVCLYLFGCYAEIQNGGLYRDYVERVTQARAAAQGFEQVLADVCWRTAERRPRAVAR